MRRVALSTLLLSLSTSAGELKGVTMPETLTVAGKELKLNGMGLRTRVVFKVYVAGLYLENKTSDPQKIIAADSVRRVQLSMLRDFDKQKIVAAIIEGVERNSKDKMAALKERLDKFSAAIPDLKEGQVLSLTYVPGRGTTVAAGEREVTIEGKDFADALFLVWLGIPSEEDLKKGLLTLKPEALSMVLEHRAEERGKLPSGQEKPVEPQAAAQASGTPLTILFGSVTGASQELAMRLAQRARAAGHPAVVADLDSRTAQLAASPGPVVIVTSTYNGEPPDNARRFAAWLATPGQAASTLAGVRYAVLGLGNRQWRSTFQKFPRWIDERLAQLGAHRLVGVGAVDADGDSDRDAETWSAAAWPELTRELGKASSGAGAPAAGARPRAYRVEVANYAGADLKAIRPCCYPVHHEARTATVLSRKELLPYGAERSTVHLEVSLPGGLSYRPGDHLGVFPENPFELVHAVAERCGLRALDVVILRSEGGDADDESTPIPVGVPLFVRDLLTHHVDLTGPVTRAELRALAERCPCPPERDALLQLSSEERFRTDVLEPRLTIVDVLLRYRSIPTELGQFVAMRPVVKPRYYSISSSPRLLARACTITVGLHQFAGPGGDPREGLCSSYLAGLEAGAGLRIVVRDNGGGFRLPEDPAADIILVGAGTGLAPLRGFLQERQALSREGRKLGRSLLFFGCRRPDEDYLYREELEAYVADGTLTGLYPAFSREPGRPRTYVQERLRERGEEVASLIKGGATVYVCGDARRFAPDVRAAFAEVLRREGALDTAAATDERLATLKAQGRYLEDIWASS